MVKFSTQIKTGNQIRHNLISMNDKISVSRKEFA